MKPSYGLTEDEAAVGDDADGGAHGFLLLVDRLNVRLSGSKKAIRRLNPQTVDVTVELSQRQEGMVTINLGPENVTALAWIEMILATPVVLWGGWPFFERGWASIVHRSPNMFTLIAIGVGVIVFMSALLAGLQANFIRRVLTAQPHIPELRAGLSTSARAAATCSSSSPSTTAGAPSTAKFCGTWSRAKGSSL